MRKHQALIFIGLAIAALFMLSSPALADTAKYIVSLYRISNLGPPPQYESTPVGSADITATEKYFVVQANLHAGRGLPNTKYRFGFAVAVGAKWLAIGSELTTDGTGAGSATIKMNIPEKASKPYTVVVGLAKSGKYITSKPVTLLNAP